MLGWILFGALLGAAAVMIYVSYLDRSVMKEKLQENDIIKGKIREMIYSKDTTCIKLSAINTNGEEQEVEIEADDYNENEIWEGLTIYV